MRTLRVALLAAPVIALVYVRAALGRSLALRLALVVSVGALLATAAIALVRPVETTARPPVAAAPIAPSAFTTTLRTGIDVHDAIPITFTRPMDVAQVAAAITVSPDAGLRLAWSGDGRTLQVSPATRWATGTFYTITVGGGATSRDGQPLGAAVRAAFVTRLAGTVTLSRLPSADGADPLRPAVAVRSDVPIDPAGLRASLRTTPDVALVVTSRAPAGEAATEFDVRPAGDLAPGTIYRFSVAAGLLDAEGSRVAAADPLAIRTIDAPAVVRFRPGESQRDVAADAQLSVRFSRPMDRASTQAAFSATDGTRRIRLATTKWSDGGRVLVAVPARPFRAGATITLAVTATATSADGIALVAPATASFTVASPPKARAAPRRPAPASTSGSSASRAPSGSSAGSATWLAVERYYLKLMNCTRTGGWVTSTGSCSSPGGRDVAPLALSSGISAKVSRPYAKLLATRDECSHFIGGTPGDRLRRAGYTSYRWAENIGCRSGDPYAAVLASHLFFQSEKSYGGGHYVNLMNAQYDRCGIGVWVASGRVRLVVDFYHP